MPQSQCLGQCLEQCTTAVKYIFTCHSHNVLGNVWYSAPLLLNTYLHATVTMSWAMPGTVHRCWYTHIYMPQSQCLGQCLEQCTAAGTHIFTCHSHNVLGNAWYSAPLLLSTYLHATVTMSWAMPGTVHHCC